jgi:ATP-binding protein involved in chromosome partitioning
MIQETRSAPKGLPPKADISVKHVVLVLSGKGGVGKSTVSANLAYSLANRGYNTGLIDLDIHGPDIPKMLGVEDARLQSFDGKVIEPVRVTGNLAIVSMAFLLPERNTPVIWRGPMKMTVIKQFLEDVNWGDLDYLVVDLPPGTVMRPSLSPSSPRTSRARSSSPPRRMWQSSTRARRSSL